MEPTAANEQMGLVIVLVYLAFIIFMIACSWKIFTKAGEPGWACLIPIYSYIVFLKITSRPWWWLLLTFIPLVGLVIFIINVFDLAKSFGKGVGYGFGLLFLTIIFFPMLAFGSSSFTGREA